MTEVDAKTLITPATTPGSVGDDERSLVPRSSRHPLPSKTSWYCRYPPPYAILTISILQLIVYIIVTKDEYKLLRYDPNRQYETWRFLSYMVLHDSNYHIILNIVMQCLFAVKLEKNQGSLRVGILYFGGGVTGALGAGCVRPDLVVGASAGVYALLISHLSHIILNFESTKYKLWSCLTITIIVSSDVIYNLLHARNRGDPIISEEAHIAGAVFGFLLGLLLYKSEDKEAKAKNRVAFWAAFILLIVLVATLLILHFQIKRCTPLHLLKTRYIYLC